MIAHFDSTDNKKISLKFGVKRGHCCQLTAHSAPQKQEWAGTCERLTALSTSSLQASTGPPGKAACTCSGTLVGYSHATRDVTSSAEMMLMWLWGGYPMSGAKHSFAPEYLKNYYSCVQGKGKCYQFCFKNYVKKTELAQLNLVKCDELVKESSSAKEKALGKISFVTLLPVESW